MDSKASIAIPLSLRTGYRALRDSPLFFFVGVVSLALAIGLPTSVFSVVSAVAFSPLPFREPDRLVEVMSTVSPQDDRIADYLAYGRIREWVGREYRTLQLLGGSAETELALRTEDGAVKLDGEVVLGDYFLVLGLQTTRGRVLDSSDDRPGAPPAAVVSKAMAIELLGGPHQALGRILQIAGSSYTVVGITPGEFAPGVQIWIPAAIAGEQSAGAWKGVGRLRDGVTVSEAAAELNQLATAQLVEDPDAFMGQGVTAVPLGSRTANLSDPTLLLLAGTVAAIFLLGLTNLTSLFMARTAGRGRNLAVRASLGANRIQLGLGLISEGFLLGIAGTVSGVLLSFWGKDLVFALVHGYYPFSTNPSLDPRVLVFASSLGLATSLILSVEPLRRIEKMDLRGLLQRGSVASTLTKSERRARNLLVAVQVGLSMVLVSAGASASTALKAFRDIGMGYDADQILEAVPDHELSGLDASAQRELAAAVVGDGFVVLARTDEDPHLALSVIRSTFNALAPDVPLAWLGTLSERQVGEGARTAILHRKMSFLAGAVAVIMAVLGLFGVVADAVVRRTREIGIRFALGASGRSVIGNLASETILTSLCGIGAGILVILPLQDRVNGILTPHLEMGLGVGQPALLAATAVAILAIGLASAIAGARRALTVDPAEALRED